MKSRFSLLALALAFAVTLPLHAEPNHNYAVWEKEIAAFEKQDQAHMPAPGGILFAGSSTIRLWTTLAQDYPGAPVINRGFGGSQIIDSTHFADRIIFPYAPRKIFLRAGGNDLWAGKSAEEVCGDFKDFVATVHAKLPQTEIYFIGWNATPSRWAQVDKERQMNHLVEEYCKTSPRLHYIEASDMVLEADGKPRPELFRKDQLHFNAAGYKLLVERVRPYVN